MSTIPKIILNNLSFHLENTPVKFDQLNLAFEQLKYGIVGANGVGKTTLLKLLLGELTPDSGAIQSACRIINIPQSHDAVATNARLADVLGVSNILDALRRINNGSISDADFELAADNWDIEQRIKTALTKLNLWPIDLNQLFHNLSGGQKTKALLAKSFILAADFLIFDEPTNNLDQASRAILSQYLAATTKGMLIVSHDRALLNNCDKIVELTTKGIEIYGGNYDFYQEQKAIKQQAIEQEIQAQTGISNKAKQTFLLFKYQIYH